MIWNIYSSLYLPSGTCDTVVYPSFIYLFKNLLSTENKEMTPNSMADVELSFSINPVGITCPKSTLETPVQCQKFGQS